jgi:hypothetical protein
MTEYDDDLTTQLTRTLTDHSDVMSGSSLGLAEVKGRARSIRRRRTATAVVGAAAAVAVIIPTVALASHTGGSKNEPAPITQTPSPTRTATDDGHQPAPGVLDVSDLPTGDAPGMEYVTDGTVLHHADGSTVDIGTQHPVNGLVTLTDGSRVFLTSTGGRFYAEVETPDGTFLDPVRTDGGLAVNHAHTVVAWVDPAGQVMLWENGAAQPEPNGDPIPVQGDLRVAAVLGDECSYSCTVFVNVPAGGA